MLDSRLLQNNARTSPVDLRRDQNICVVGIMVVSVHLAVLVPGRPFPVI